jgi:hypothetical protein
MISINKIMCCHVTTDVNVTSAACLCIFLYDHGAKRERDVTELEKVTVDLFKNVKTCQILRDYCSSQDLQYQKI